MTAASRNSFDLLRLIAALMVLWSHQFALTGTKEIYLPFFNGGLGVFIFFAISGYLNAHSLLRNPSWWRFLVRRARRIYPALLALALFTAGLAFAVTTAGPDVFWPKVPAFIAKNATILFGIDYTLPGAFTDNPYPSALNGSLWTLPSEIKLYIYLALIAVAIRYRPALLLLVLGGFLIGFLIWFHLTGKNTATAYFQQFAVIFLCGALFAITERLYGLRIAVAAVAVLAAIVAATTPAVATLPAIALLAVLAGKIAAPVWLTPRIDISYGTYLYAFPIQQLIASYGFGFIASLAASLVLTTVMALLSAIYIERPALAGRMPQQRIHPAGEVSAQRIAR